MSLKAIRQGAASAVNWVERKSGLDLDGDGDVGIKGSPTDVGPAEQSGAAASMTAARDGAADGAPYEDDVGIGAFDANQSSWLGEIGHVFDQPPAAASPPPAQAAAAMAGTAELDADGPRWYRTLSESPYRMAAQPFNQEEVVSTQTMTRWRSKGPSPERRRRAKRREGQRSPYEKYEPSSTAEELMQRARSHVAGNNESLRDVAVPPMQTTLQRKPWRHNMAPTAVAHGRRAGDATADAARAAPWQMMDVPPEQLSPATHMPSYRRAQADAAKRAAAEGKPRPMKALGPGPKGSAKPSRRPTRGSNVMVSNLLKGATKPGNPDTFRLTCLQNLTALMGGAGFVLEDPRRPRDAKKAAKITVSEEGTQPHNMEGALLDLMTDTEQKEIRDAARTAYIKFHEVWAAQEEQIIKRGEELKELKKVAQQQKKAAGGGGSGQMQSMGWVKALGT